MSYKLLIIALFLISASATTSDCHSRGLTCFCNANLYTEEQTILKEVESLIQKKGDIPIQCLEVLSNRGYYQAALKLFDEHFLMNQIDVSDRMRTSTASNRRNLENLVTTIMSSQTAVQNVRPVIQWAQNKDNIFINMKLAMRLDSPACLVCQMESVNITDEKLYVSFYGVYSHQPLRFELDLPFAKPINASESTWQLESVGTLFFNIAQQNQTDLWLDLEMNQTQQIPIWWDMREQHKQDMDEWIELLQERTNEKDNAKQNQQKQEKEEQKKKAQGATEQVQQDAQIQQQQEVFAEEPQLVQAEDNGSNTPPPEQKEDF